MRAWSRQSGQVSAELIAVVPLAILVTLAVAQLALAGWALWSAGDAARAGARAAHVGGDARAAARSALPSPLRDRAQVSEGGPVEVRVAAPSLVPGLPAVPITARADLPAGGG